MTKDFKKEEDGPLREVCFWYVLYQVFQFRVNDLLCWLRC